MIVGIDIDGILANSVAATLAKINEAKNTQLTYQDWDSWGPHDNFGMTQYELMAWMDIAWSDFYFMDFEEPKTTISDLTALQEAGHKIHIVTYRSFGSHSDVMSCLHSKNVPYDAVSMCTREFASKLEFPIDVLIDDHPRMPEAAIMFPAKKVYWIRRPWNRYVKTSTIIPNMIRLDTLHDAINHILERQEAK
jgi:uncharacterized HAD superfamily protein